MDRVESRITPRLLTWVESGTVASESRSEASGIAESFCFDPIMRASVLSPFSFSLFSVIQFLMSEKQLEKEERRLLMFQGLVLL
jgi:hypothetical protein